MSLATSSTNSFLDCGYIASEIYAILGGYRKGTFRHENLSENDLNLLNKGKELIENSLAELVRERPYFSLEKKDYIPLESILFLYEKIPKSPDEIKRNLTDYKETLQDVIEKKHLDRKKLEFSYQFFRRLSEKVDDESAKLLLLLDDDE